jgi:hypothetical protein
MYLNNIVFLLLLLINSPFVYGDTNSKYWINNFVDEQFRVFENRKIKLKDIQYIDKLINDNKLISLVRYEIVDGEVYSNYKSSSQSLDKVVHDVVKKELKYLVKKGKIKVNTTFYYCIADGVYLKHDKEPYLKLLISFFKDPKVKQYYITTRDTEILTQIQNLPPILVSAKNIKIPNQERFILSIDRTIMHTKYDFASVGLKNLRAEIDLGFMKYPWESKTEKLLWRGDITDCKFHLNVFCPKDISHRKKLLNISKKNPDLFDVKIALQNSKLPDYSVDFLSRTDQVSYKYQLVVDGMTSTYPAYYYKLYSGSLTFKQESDNVQWFYSFLKPYEHFIPVKNDLSDLVEKINWAKRNDSDAKKIASNAREFVKNHLTEENIENLFAYQINKTAEYLDFKLEKPTLEKTNDGGDEGN